MWRTQPVTLLERYLSCSRPSCRVAERAQWSSPAGRMGRGHLRPEGCHLACHGRPSFHPPSPAAAHHLPPGSSYTPSTAQLKAAFHLPCLSSNRLQGAVTQGATPFPPRGADQATSHMGGLCPGAWCPDAAPGFLNQPPQRLFLVLYLTGWCATE